MAPGRKIGRRLHCRSRISAASLKLVDRPEFLSLLGAESVSWVGRRRYPVHKQLALVSVALGPSIPPFPTMAPLFVVRDTVYRVSISI